MYPPPHLQPKPKKHPRLDKARLGQPMPGQPLPATRAMASQRAARPAQHERYGQPRPTTPNQARQGCEPGPEPTKASHEQPKPPKASHSQPEPRLGWPGRGQLGGNWRFPPNGAVRAFGATFFGKKKNERGG